MSEVEKAIKQQVLANEDAPSSLRHSLKSLECPVWWDSEAGYINEPLLVAEIIDNHGLHKIGSRTEDSAGKLITPDDLKRFISNKISPYVPQGTSRRLYPIFNLLRVQIPVKSNVPPLETITLAELEKMELTPTQFVVDQLLPCGLTLFAAPPKIGKSWLCIALAEAVATGNTFWGYQTNPGSVLYLCLEDNELRLRNRAHQIGLNMNKNVSVTFRRTMCLNNGLVEQLEQWINTHPDARLIILDTLQRIKGAAQYGMDAYAGDYDRLSPLQSLAIEKNVSIIAVHHFRKQGNVPGDDIYERIAGSTALFGVSDCAWLISGKRGSEEMTFHLTGRDVVESEFKIKKENNRWQMLGDSEQLEEQRKLDEYRTSPLVKTIRELVKESGGRWEGGATLLQAEVMKRTQTVPSSSDRELKQIVLDLREQLLKNDGIAVTHRDGGRKGRGYTFETARQTTL